MIYTKVKENTFCEENWTKTVFRFTTQKVYVKRKKKRKWYHSSRFYRKEVLDPIMALKGYIIQMEMSLSLFTFQINPDKRIIRREREICGMFILK